MDTFFYIIDMFAFASDEEGLPKNEEDPRSSGSANGPPGCVVAWDASFPIHIWRTTTTPSYVCSFILGSNIIIINSSIIIFTAQALLWHFGHLVTLPGAVLLRSHLPVTILFLLFCPMTLPPALSYSFLLFHSCIPPLSPFWQAGPYFLQYKYMCLRRM